MQNSSTLKTTLPKKMLNIAHNSRGFTLLEVIIAVTILAFLSLFTARMIQQGVKARSKFQKELDIRSGLQSALELMSEDIGRAFNYRDINVELYNAAQSLRRSKKMKPDKGAKKDKDKDPLVTSPPQPPVVLTPEEEAEYRLKEVVVYSRFYGEADKLDFTAISSHRPRKDIQQSDQVEIGYYLDNCTSRIKKSQSSNCLWRRISHYIDDEIKEGGKSQVVLENVKSLKFRYLGPGHTEKWNESWMSEKGEEVMKNNFPYAVEITLTINDTRFSPPKELGMTVVAPVLFPNNKVEAPGAAPTQ